MPFSIMVLFRLFFKLVIDEMSCFSRVAFTHNVPLHPCAYIGKFHKLKTAYSFCKKSMVHKKRSDFSEVRGHSLCQTL